MAGVKSGAVCCGTPCGFTAHIGRNAPGHAQNETTSSVLQRERICRTIDLIRTRSRRETSPRLGPPSKSRARNQPSEIVQGAILSIPRDSVAGASRLLHAHGFRQRGDDAGTASGGRRADSGADDERQIQIRRRHLQRGGRAKETNRQRRSGKGLKLRG